MKRIGILFGLLLLGACMVWAQDNSANSTSTTDNGNNSATQSQSQTTTTTTNDNDNGSSAQTQSDQDQNNNAHHDTVTEQKQATDQSRKDAAVNDENAADTQKDKAKDATTKGRCGPRQGDRSS